MRLSFVLSLCLAAVLLTGCKTKYYYVDAGVPLGHDCPNGDECYGGSFCLEGKCTINCQTNADCAGFEGTECRPLGDAAVLTCVTVRYIKGAATPGTPCGVDPLACSADPQCDPVGNCEQSCTSDDECSPSYRCSPDFNICVRKLFCYGRQTDDPDSLCTQECVDDRDCPAKLYCENVPTTTLKDRKLCVGRKFCTPCEFDSDCDMLGGVCATDQYGVKFCTTECTPPVALPEEVGCNPNKDIDANIDCRGVGDGGRNYVCVATNQGGTWVCRDPNLYNCPQPYSECKDSGDGRSLCYHRYGSCKGNGSLCSPCRSRKDCDEASGALCYRNSYTQERFCTSTCTGNTCPDATYVCFTFNNDCSDDSSCYAPDGTCDTNAGACSPVNPPQCLKDFSPTSTSNPRYPTCWPDQAGYCCN
jgi:hypothetical protein